MSYKQWVTIHITNKMSSGTLSVKNSISEWGKFCDYRDKDKEISPEEISNITVSPGGSADICACCREGSPSGTTGSLDLYDGNDKICKVKWDCPFTPAPGGKNEFSLTDQNNKYSVQVGKWDKNSEAIGEVSVEVGKV